MEGPNLTGPHPLSTELLRPLHLGVSSAKLVPWTKAFWVLGTMMVNWRRLGA